MATATPVPGAVEPDAEKSNPQLDAARQKADEQNKSRTGKGTRLRVGQTRGRNPQVITWEAFDDSQPETLPTSLSEFMEVAKVSDEKAIVGMLIDGFNAQAYGNASDPIAEYVNPVWPEEIQRNFRLAVRNYSNATQVSLEEAAALIKPGIDKVHGKTA